MKRGAAVVFALAISACGSRPGVTDELRARLDSAETEAARERAPDLVGDVESALDAAEDAELRGDYDAAADYATRARLLLDAAEAEAARVTDEDARRELEVRIANVLQQARRDEQARQTIGRELARAASVRAAREEEARALTQAEEDESRGARRGRVSMDQAQDLRRAAAALRARAELTMAAARALGASEEALGPATEALASSERARTDPLAALAAADRAHHEALTALGAVRRELSGPGPDAARELAEAAVADGFSAEALSEGTAVEAEGLFSGNGLARHAEARVLRLVSLIAAHPFGPVQVQAQVPSRGRGGDRMAQRRSEALRRALVAAGADESRLSASAIPSALAPDAPVDRARLVFPGYASAP